MNQMRLPVLGRINKIIIIVSAVLFIVNAILVQSSGVSLLSTLGLSISKFSTGYIHQILTYPLINRGLMSIIFNGLLLWFIGSELEHIWGVRRYISFLLTSTIGGALIFLTISFFSFVGLPLSQVPLIGLSGICSALAIAYGILFPDRQFTFMFIIPIKAKYFSWLIVVIELYMGFFSPAKILAWGHLGTIASGFIFMWYVANKALLKQKRENVRRKTNVKRGSHLSIVQDDDDENPPKYWQ